MRFIVSLCFISVSLIGLFLIIPLTFKVYAIGFTTQKADVFWRKIVISSFFGLICLLGIMAGVFPSKCSGSNHVRKKIKENNRGNDKQGVVDLKPKFFEGHHPNCGNFSSHVMLLRGKKYCAGCTGLVIGAVLFIFGILTYLLTGLSIGEKAVLPFFLGFAGVALGLLQYSFFKMRRSSIHFILNVLFVLGVLLLFIGIEELTRSIFLELYLVALSLYWILTRIMLSKQGHRKVCAACGLKSCLFF